jgi:hypothetical protein
MTSNFINSLENMKIYRCNDPLPDVKEPTEEKRNPGGFSN